MDDLAKFELFIFFVILAGAGGAASKATSASKPPAGSNGKRPAWDLKGRMEDMESAMKALKSKNVDLKGKVCICHFI